MASLLPVGELQFFDDNGASLSGGFVAYYVPNTLTPKNTFQDVALTILNQNPVPLDGAGRCTVYGTGSYDMRLYDQYMNLIYAGSTAAYLAESSVGSFMVPVIAATSSAQFITVSGVGSYVAAACNAISLMPGPVGPVGPASTIPGPAGPQGVPGSYPVPTYATGNPRYFKDGATGYLQCSGTSTTSGGIVSIPFPTAFTSAPTVLLTVHDAPINVSVRAQTIDQYGFGVYCETSNNQTSDCNFGWLAVGF